MLMPVRDNFPPPTPQPSLEITDFLRRLARLMSSGKNAEMLLQASHTIEELTRRAEGAEYRFRAQQEDHARDIELLQASGEAADALRSEIVALKAELEEGQRQADEDRTIFAEERRGLEAAAADAQKRLTALNAELEELRKPAAALDPSIAVLPVQPLQLARAQFDHLAEGFAKTGDVISMTICQIGTCAIEKALASGGMDTPR